MRSVFFYLEEKSEGIIDKLGKIAERGNDRRWYFPNCKEAVIWLDVNNTFVLKDHSSEEIKEIQTRVGENFILVSVDVSGRIIGKPEVNQIASILLGESKGIAMNEVVQRFWSLDDITLNKTFDGSPFFPPIGK